MSLCTMCTYIMYVGICTFILFIYVFIINFSQKDRGHTKGKPVLGAPPYTHTYIHTYNYKDKIQRNKQKLYIHTYIESK